MVIQTKNIDDDVVISGMAGRFPECDNVADFRDKLLSGIDLVKENDSRWPKGYLGTFSRMGFIKDLRNFDASFFGAHPKLAERTDPIVRTLLETSVEAVMDAGICPTKLRGTETGVVVVVSSNEAADWWSADPDRVNGYEFLGCTRTMYSNRISFVLDLKGPSYTMDSQSSSGLLGVQQAYYMLKTGMVDAVIVAGVNLVLNPHFNIMFKKLNMLSPEGKCKVFDADADGYARSEAGVALLMQRLKDAKRVYATVVATESNCDGFKEFGCNSESLESQISLYRAAYDRFNVNPLDISFLEAHGYSTREGDKIELNGVAKILCKERNTPLLVGSVKSNMGHSEPAGGLVSVVKTILAMESGILPPHLHFTTPNPEIPALRDGRLKVVDKPTVWNGEYAAINSFGIGGTNSHLVLRKNGKEKKPSVKIDIPRLMTVSGRTESAVKSLLQKVEYLQDNEFCTMLYNIFSEHITHFNYRAFSVFDSNNDVVTEISTYTPKETSRPVCFVFSGMGSQWPGMCKKLLKIRNFERTIDRCARVLETVAFDLIRLLNSEEKLLYDNVLNSFVGITCIQIALVNVLRELEIYPDYLIGHSIGELACAYADDTLTLEQTVLATYWRGKSLQIANITPGAMAAVGLNANEISKLLPPEVSVACHNSNDSVTISGPRDSISNVTRRLQNDGIFAREINSSGYAFHSKYIAEAGPIFESKLTNIIPNPKLRSKRWISTSVPESQWNTPSAQYSSVEYHLNNLLSSVFFDAALKHMPENAVVIEIAPHALLQSILKSGLSSKCSHIGLARRNQARLVDFLANIGRLYNVGLQPKVEKLYPPVSFPVSRSTPMIQSLIEWDHSIKWFLVSFTTNPPCVHGEIEAYVDITEDRYKFLSNCLIDDTSTFPISGYLNLIWEAVAKFQLNFISNVPIVIENFQLLRKCVLSRQKPLKFTINILEESGECEIREENEIVARANVKVPENVENEFHNLENTAPTKNSSRCLPLKPADVYFDLSTKGYSYRKEFRGIKYVDILGERGKLKWEENWTTFLETMLQLHLLRIPKQRHYFITHIHKVIIDPRKHIGSINDDVTDLGTTVNVFPDIDVIRSGGIEFSGIKSTLVSVRKHHPEPIIQYYTFVPHESESIITLPKALAICTQIVCENVNTKQTLKIAEIISDKNTCFTPTLVELIAKEPYIKEDVTIYSAYSLPQNVNKTTVRLQNHDFSMSILFKEYNLIISKNILTEQTSKLRNICSSLTEGGFVITLESSADVLSEEQFDNFGCKLICKYHTENGICLLIRKTLIWKTPMVVIIRPDTFNWLDGIKTALRKHKIDKRNTMIIFQGKETTGIVGLLKSIRREAYGIGLRCLFTDDSIQPYKIVDLTYIDYFRKGLAFNVYKNGQWGSYRHFDIDKTSAAVECEHAFIGAKRVGDFSSLGYIEGRIPYIDGYIHEDFHLCRVYYACVYPHQDVFKALGRLPIDNNGDKIKQGSVLGHEFSGRNSEGRRVFGMVGGGALATTVLADKAVLWDVPDHWTLEQASTVPRVYSVAYYTLIIRAKLQKGETIYIHAGIMGLCVACLNVALGAEAKPFIGYNNETEKKYLRETFPNLPDTSLVNVEEGSFEYHLLETTDGQGVDVIFDTLNSHKRNSFVDCLNRSGRLIEFEKSSTFNESLGYTAIEKNISFHKISHNTLWVSEAGLESRRKIRELVREGVQTGVVKPIVTNIFSDQQIEKAFRVAQSGKFIGKIVIKFRDEESQKCLIPKAKLVSAYPSAFLNPNYSYIVTTALSDYGIQLIEWLISRGGVNIIAHSQYKPVIGYQCLALERWKNQNVNIVLSTVDISTLNGAETLINDANSLGPVNGIFHLGQVGCESSIEKSVPSHFELLWKIKVEYAKNLDIASRKSCSSLKYFVAFSEISSSFGERAKSMFGYACAAMESIFESRKIDDYPALVIQKGEVEQFDLDSKHEGFTPLKFSSILQKLPELLNQPYTVVSVYAKDVEYMLPKKFDHSSQNELVNNIANILGIRNPIESRFQTFEQIGLEPVALERIQKILQNHGVDVSKSDILKLSFDQISSIKPEESVPKIV